MAKAISLQTKRRDVFTTRNQRILEGFVFSHVCPSDTCRGIVQGSPAHPLPPTDFNVQVLRLKIHHQKLSAWCIIGQEPLSPKCIMGNQLGVDNVRVVSLLLQGIFVELLLSDQVESILIFSSLSVNKPFDSEILNEFKELIFTLTILKDFENTKRILLRSFS